MLIRYSNSIIFRNFVFNEFRQNWTCFKEKAERLHKSRKMKSFGRVQIFQIGGCRKMRGRAPHFSSTFNLKIRTLTNASVSWSVQPFNFFLERSPILTNSLKTKFRKILEFEYLISTNCFLQGIKLKMIEKRDILKQSEFEVSSLNINKIDLIKKFHER